MIPSDLTDPEGNGQWAPLVDWPLIAIHAMMLPDGRVITYGTDENGMQGGQFVYALYDYRTGTSELMEQTTETDLFCSNMALDAYLGLTLMMGGDEEPLGYRAQGVNDVNAFDYRTNTIAPATEGDMAAARWYPTVVTMGDGQIFALGGRVDHARGTGGDTTLEVYRSGHGWRTLDNIELPIDDFGKWWYPTTWLRSDGKAVMFEGTSGDGGADFYLIDLDGEGSLTHLGVSPFNFGVQEASIMYRTDLGLMMDYFGRIWSVDFSTDDIVFTQVAEFGERHADSEFALLADGRVAIVGGSTQRNNLEEAHTEISVWDPDTGILETYESEDLARLYHSTALMMPDGTLATLGGGAPGPLVNTNAQFWAPDYLFDEDGNLAERMEIEADAGELYRGERFILSVDDSSALTRLTALKSAAVTHSKNADARFLELDYVILDDNTIEVILPENENILTPGTWMVFAFDDHGVPSEAELLNIQPGVQVADHAPGFYTFGTSTYMLGTPGQTWTEAVAEAEALGGRLLEIESAAENQFVLDTFFRDNPVWLGLNDIETEGVFQTQDGDTPAYLNFTDITFPNRDAAHSFAIMTAPDGTWRMSRDAPTPAVFDDFGRPVRAPTLTVIEFENTRDLVVQTGEVTVPNISGSDWHYIAFDHEMIDPVVILAPPTRAGAAPIAPRVRDVDGDGFEVLIQEFDYLDGPHAYETLSWMAVERGVHVLGDGGVIEAGTHIADGTASEVSLTGDFGPHAPVILAQVASDIEANAVTDRLSDVTPDGFDLQLQREEASADQHGPETVGWVAFSTGNYGAFGAFQDEGFITHIPLDVETSRSSGDGRFFADIQSTHEEDPITLRITNVDGPTVQVGMQEDRSADHEMRHAEETLGWLTIDDTVYATPQRLVLQTGAIRENNADGSQWVRITFGQEMIDPIVSLSPASLNGDDAVAPRIRNVDGQGFEFLLEEWDYLDGRHITESLSWIAVERGVHRFEDGAIIEAGRTTSSSEGSDVSFLGGFDAEAPVVLTQVTSDHDTTAVIDRAFDVRADGFHVLLQTEEAIQGGHGTESLDYIAFSSGAFEGFSAYSAPRAVTHMPLSLERTREDAFVFAETQSLYGDDPATLRFSRIHDDMVQVLFHEEQSRDLETVHFREDLGWIEVGDALFL